jgi:hypothetical protein
LVLEQVSKKRGFLNKIHVFYRFLSGSCSETEVSEQLYYTSGWKFEKDIEQALRAKAPASAAALVLGFQNWIRTSGKSWKLLWRHSWQTFQGRPLEQLIVI